MGGDFAPNNIVTGITDALRETNNRFEILLIGQETILQKLTKPLEQENLSFKIIHTSQTIDMNDTASTWLRQKKDSSIVVGINLHKKGAADAFISAGHTGAVMSASTIILGKLQGVTRPTIGAFLPTENSTCLLLDAGANIDCKPQHLYQFAIMGSIYIKEIFNIERPTLGLLNIGEETTKGTDIIRETFKLLNESSLNFIGNIEGRDILEGKANVVVCDGLIGNIILKFAESIPNFLKKRLKKSANKSLFSKIVNLLMRNTLKKALTGMDYEEYGGVPILGVCGVSIIGHGKSTPKAIKNMILRAEEMVRKNINQRIQHQLADMI